MFPHIKNYKLGNIQYITLWSPSYGTIKIYNTICQLPKCFF
jgi:hypothetical protein